MSPAAPLTLVVPSLSADRALLAACGRWAAHRRVQEVLLVLPRGAAAGAATAPAGVRVLEAPLGRASQMNAGAAAARGDFLFFVHGDTRVGDDAISAVAAALGAEPDAAFALSLRFDSLRRGFRVLEALSRLRHRVLPFPLGDQGLALARGRFAELGGFPDEPLFEDVRMSRSLRRRGPVRVLPGIALTDAARMERRGIFRNFVHNLILVVAHALGVSPRRLVRSYYGADYLERWLAADPGRRGDASRAPAPSPSS